MIIKTANDASFLLPLAAQVVENQHTLGVEKCSVRSKLQFARVFIIVCPICTRISLMFSLIIRLTRSPLLHIRQIT